MRWNPLTRLLLPALLGATAAFAQQQNTPPAPQPIPATPFQRKQPDCSGSAKSGDHGKWATSSTCPQQDNTKSPPPLDAAKPADSTDNAFPEEQSKKAAAAANGQQSEPSDHSTAKGNPFPEEQSEKAAQQANQAPAAPADPNSSSSRQNLNRLDLLGNDNGVQGYAKENVHDPKLAVQDNRVGSFYMNTGDYQGAYNRFKEATQVDPANADSVFELAEAARSLGKRQEAQQNYQIYLEALPKGPKAKDARKALAEMEKGK